MHNYQQDIYFPSQVTEVDFLCFFLLNFGQYPESLS